MKYTILIFLLYLSLTLQKSATQISLNETINFDHEENLFELSYDTVTPGKSFFFLFYDKTGDLEIEIYDEETEEKETETISDDKGYILIPCFKDKVIYSITFISENASGNFKVLTSERPISFDFKDKIKINKMEIKSNIAFNPFIFTFENNLDKDFMKRFEPDDREDIFNISISENLEDFKEIKNDCVYFQKGKKYYIKVEFLERKEEGEDETINIMNPFSITEFDINNVTMKEFSYGPMYNEKYHYVYTKINLNDFDYFDIETYGDGVKIQYVLLNDESQLNAFPQNIQYLNFSLIPSYSYEKPENATYMILFIDFDSLDFCVVFSKPMPIELNEEKEANQTNYYFKLIYDKKSEKKELLYIFYDFQKEGELIIQCQNGPKIGYSLPKKGTVDYPLTVNDECKFFFDPSAPSSSLKGKIKIVSSEYEFTVDAKEELFIPKNKDTDAHREILFSVINIDKNYLKLFSSKDELKNIISYSKKDSDFVLMENALFLFEKGESLKIKVNVENIESEFHISNIDENQVTDLISNKTYEFKDPLNQIFKINYLNTPYFKIEGDVSINYFISYVTEDQYNQIPKGIENLNLSNVTNTTLQKPDNYYYSVLIAEIKRISIGNTTLIIKELEKPINDLVFDSEQSFDSFKSNYQFDFKKPEKREMNLLMYKIDENGQDFEIKIEGPNNFKKNESISSKEKNGAYAFELGESGSYNLSFNSNKIYEGVFKLVNASKEIKMNINDDVRFKSFKTDFKPSPVVMVFNTAKENPVIYKKLLVGDDNKQLNLVHIDEINSNEYKNLSSNLFVFKGGKEYKVEVDYNELGENEYKMEKFSMTNYSETLEDFKLGNLKYNNDDLNFKFFKIDFSKSPKTEIKIIKNNPKIKILNNTDDADLTKIINDLSLFKDFTDKIILGGSDKKAILMIELNPGETEIEFNEYKEGGSNLTLILAIVIPIVIIILLIVIFLIYRKVRRNKPNNDFKDDDEKKDIILMPDTA